MTPKAALLDTSFFIRLLKDDDPLSGNADQYFRHFLQQNIAMVISTVAVAEYCVKGNISELPFRNLKVLPFTIKHAECAGTLARIAFDARKHGSSVGVQRSVVPNDTKLFAQAHTEAAIRYYVSSDADSRTVFEVLHSSESLDFEFIDLHTPHHEYFGRLNL